MGSIPYYSRLNDDVAQAIRFEDPTGLYYYEVGPRDSGLTISGMTSKNRNVAAQRDRGCFYGLVETDEPEHQITITAHQVDEPLSHDDTVTLIDWINQTGAVAGAGSVLGVGQPWAWKASIIYKNGSRCVLPVCRVTGLDNSGALEGNSWSLTLTSYEAPQWFDVGE